MLAASSAAEAATKLEPDRPLSVSLFKRCRSARISAAPWYRSVRSFSSALSMIRSSSGGKSGFSRTAGTGARFKIASEITPGLSPRKGSVPVAISYSTAPNENKSVRASRSFARACSGDMYATVPSVAARTGQMFRGDAAAAFFRWRRPASNERPARQRYFANPKSRIFACPRLVTKIFAGLMSR